MNDSEFGAIEFFSGLGGFSESLRQSFGNSPLKVTAIDINASANEVFRLNFDHEVICKTIESLTPEIVGSLGKTLWWLSPPCQPFTRRGLGRDLSDSRSAAFLRILELIDHVRPVNVALENVPEFQGSESHEKLINVLSQAGYQSQERLICPSEFGVPNRRKRYFLVASQEEVVRWRDPEFVTGQCFEVEEYLDREVYRIDPNLERRFEQAMDLVDRRHNIPSGPLEERTTSCFTRAYGRSPVRSGSYLRDGGDVRHFSPREILLQLGFSGDFQLPDWEPRRLWRLTGNSLSVPCVRYVIEHLPLLAQAATSSAPIEKAENQ